MQLSLIGRWRLDYIIFVLVLGSLAIIEKNRCSLNHADFATVSPLTKTAVSHIECKNNPYRDSLNTTFADMADMSQNWLNGISDHFVSARRNETWNEHNRFQVFQPFGSCQESCVGGACRDDVSKIVCGLQFLQEGCIVYSIGGNNNWDFELDLLAKTPCQVHTFDCTGPKSRFKKPDKIRLHFHHICVAAEFIPAPKSCDNGPETICGSMMTIQQIQSLLNHTRIDLLKMDIEGFEWPILESWPELEEDEISELPYQILIEIHYKSQFIRIDTPFAPRELVKLQEHLLKMGYATVVRDDNPYCPHCTELTLIRFQCHPRLK